MNVRRDYIASCPLAEATLYQALFSAAWDPISSKMIAACSLRQSETASAGLKRFTLQVSVLKGLWDECAIVHASRTPWTDATNALIRTIIGVLVEQLDEQFRNGARHRLKTSDGVASQRLKEVIENFGQLFCSDDELNSVGVSFLPHHYCFSDYLNSESGCFATTQYHICSIVTISSPAAPRLLETTR